MCTDPLIDESRQSDDVGDKLRSPLLLLLFVFLSIFFLLLLLFTVSMVIPHSRPSNEGPAVTIETRSNKINNRKPHKVNPSDNA